MILRSDYRSLKSEVRSPKPEVGSRMPEDGKMQLATFKLLINSLCQLLTASCRLLLSASRSIAYCLLPIALFFTGCYSFRDVSIPPEVKTIRIGYFENRARYVNPQLGPQFTDKLRQKINNQTRLTQIQGVDAHYDIGGTITGYNVTTAAISDQQAATNRLTVTIHLVFRNNLDPTKNQETDVSRNFDFSANLSLQQAEAQLTETIIRNMVDEVFNRIFSNW